MSCDVSRRKLPPKLRRADTVNEGDMPLTLFGAQSGALLRKQRSYESINDTDKAPPPEALTRRKALVPEENKDVFKKNSVDDTNLNQEKRGSESQETDNVIIVPHVQISPGDLHLYNRAITNRGGILTELQKATTAAQAFYAESDAEAQKPKSSWIFKRLYEWSHRAKTREIVRHARKALANSDHEFQDEHLHTLLDQKWQDIFPDCLESSTVEQKRLNAVWELLHSEAVFLYKHLLVLRNVYKEPLKKCQVEGCLLFVEPELLFGNLEELCQVSFCFCKEFLKRLKLENLKGHYAPTDIIVNLFDRFSKGPSTIASYQAYCINYKATMEYLESIRKSDERFVEFEKVCMHDSRCHRLQLEDLLISPLHRITRLPILLKEIIRYAADPEDKKKLEDVTEIIRDSLRSIDDSIQWLHNFERLQELQNQLIWPPILERDPKIFVPDFLKLALSRQFCENLLAHPRRKLIHEGVLYTFDNQKQTEFYAFLFNDMFLMTKCKNLSHRGKRTMTQSFRSCDSSYRFVVVKQPVPLDSCVFCDVGPQDATMPPLRHAFVILHLTRFYQVVGVYTLQAASKEAKESWIHKFQESIESYESIQLKDMLKYTPVLSRKSNLTESFYNRERRCSRDMAVQTNEEKSDGVPSAAQNQNFLHV